MRGRMHYTMQDWLTWIASVERTLGWVPSGELRSTARRYFQMGMQTSEASSYLRELSGDRW